MIIVEAAFDNQCHLPSRMGVGGHTPAGRNEQKGDFTLLVITKPHFLQTRHHPASCEIAQRLAEKGRQGRWQPVIVARRRHDR